MTNWKFSAFFAVALMLIAGLFSTTAMAADGDGAMTIETITALESASTDENDLEADSIITMTFRYTFTAEDRMEGGLLQMAIPPDWEFAAADTAASPAIDAGGVTAPANRLSGATDKTVRVPIGAPPMVEITLTNIRVPIPARLTDGDRDARYEEYEFTASSRTRSGRLRELDPDRRGP